MTRTWINAIYDRTYGDIQNVQMYPDQENPKGCWNAIDLNRIEKNTAYCAEYMLEKKIVRTPPSITVRENNYWTGDMIPTQTEIARIIGNVRTLVNLSSSNPVIADRLPSIYVSTQINYVLANQIEYALELMHNQPKLPLEYWNLDIEHGIVVSVIRDGGTTELINSNHALVAEDEVVTIQGVEYGEYAQYQTFTNWSGDPDDIALLAHYDQSPTTFTMPYRDVEFTANFETHIPRTLTLTNGYISPQKDPTAETGPRTWTCYAGDEIMIIADIAPSGKAFYEWLGTQEGLDNIVGVTESEDPSTCILTMPDCDVSLESHYINAGKHYVTVTNGSGSGWYDYNEYVSISANVPSHYGFDNWSGNTSYLEDIYSSYQSFKMGDTNLNFRANSSYRYSYNNAQIIEGYISIEGANQSNATNLRQGSTYTLIPNPPDNTQGILNWTVEGEGYVQTDYLGNQTNTFVVGDGNAIVTGNYDSLRTLSIVNTNNSGNTSTSSIVQGRKARVETNEVSGDYIFTNWTVDGVVKSSSLRYDFTMPSDDYTLTANYRAKNQVNITINYGTHTETITMQERSSRSISADSAPSGKHFVRWDYSGLYSFGNRYSSSTSFVAGSGDGSITAVYEEDIIYTYHTLTVNGGTGSGSVREGTGQTIDATQAPATYEFDYWEINSGNGTIDNIYSKQTTFRMNTTDAEITAHYKQIPSFTVTMENGYVWDGSNWVTSATLLRNAINAIKMKPAPTGEQFLQWEVYVNGVLQTNADDVYEPLAEQTRLRNLLRNVTLKATYYIPDPEVTYTLTIERKDGSIEQNDYAAGTDVQVSASSPDTGMEFYKWTGDTAYVAGGIYNENTYIHMPAQSMQIKENYVPEGYIPEFDLDMTNIYGECCYETEYEDPETHEITTTEHWVSRYSYPEGSTVKIRATGFGPEYYFDSWSAINHDTEADARSVISQVSSANTTLQMPDYDIDVEPNIALKTTYRLTVNDGGTSGNYYEGAKADIYFGKEDTDNIHYIFTRWTGSNISQLELYDGGMFSVTTAGDVNNPQFIKMPARATEVTATYKTLYKLSLTGGTIDTTGTTKEYYETGKTISITADPAPTGMRFQYWSGDTSRLASKWDPTTTVQTTTGATNLTAVYSTDTDRNNTGYVTSSLKNVSTVDNNDITIISGEINIGFIITDSNGHTYVVTNIDSQNNTSTIYRMTKIVKGGNIYG